MAPALVLLSFYGEKILQFDTKAPHELSPSPMHGITQRSSVLAHGVLYERSSTSLYVQ